MAVFVRRLSLELPLGEIVFGRNAIALLVLLIVSAARRELSCSLRTERPLAHLSRGLTGLAALALNFATLAYLPVTEAVALMYLSPIFVVLLAGLFAGEPVGARCWLSVCVGFVGVTLVLEPYSTGVFNSLIGPLAGIMGALLMAVAVLQVRSLARTESITAITVYFSLVGTVAAGFSVATGWKVPVAQDCLMLAGLGLFGAASHVLVTSALTRADASFLAAFEFLSVVWAIGFDAAIFSKHPTTSTMIGTVLVIAGSIIVIIRSPLKSAAVMPRKKPENISKP